MFTRILVKLGIRKEEGENNEVNNEHQPHGEIIVQIQNQNNSINRSKEQQKEYPYHNPMDYPQKP